MHRQYFVGIFLVMTALTFLAYHELSLLPDGKLHVYFLDIGQGDATFIVSPSGRQILVDGGPNTQTLQHLGTFMPFFDRTIELLVVTHPDTDHLVALPDALERYIVERIMLSGIADDNPRYHAILDGVTRKNIPIVQPDPLQDIDLGDGLTLDVIWPEPNTFATVPKNTNDTSIVLRLLYGEHRVLLTGDIEEPAERGILSRSQNVQSNVIKVAHHGSSTSSSTGFLLAVKPDLTIISAGRDNPYGHPHQEVLDRLSALGIDIRSTVEEGTIELTFE